MFFTWGNGWKNNRSIVKTYLCNNINIMIFKKYLKDPLSTIAVNTTIFIAGYPFFGILATIGVVSEFVRDYKNLQKT